MTRIMSLKLNYLRHSPMLNNTRACGEHKGRYETLHNTVRQ